MRKIFFFILATMIAVNAFGYEKQTWDYTDGSKETITSSYYYNLDIYYPETGEAPYPVLIYIGPEAWLNSNFKEAAYQLTSAFLKYALQRGYAVVCPNNRQCGYGTYFPAPIQDYRAVVRFLHNNGEGVSEGPRDIDTSFIAFSGYILGSFSAMLMGMTRNMNEYNNWDFEGTVGNFLDKSSSVDAVADFGCVSAQTDSRFCPHYYNSVFGCANTDFECASWNQMCRPILVPKTLSNNWAPTIMVYGDNNPTLPKQDVTAMYNDLKNKLGDDCELHTHHNGFGFPTDNATFEAVMNFLDRIRAKKQAQAIESPSLQGRSGEASKFIQDGQLFILRGDKTFNAIGTQVK